jgi:CDP-glucose 4,6-dehydratase
VEDVVSELAGFYAGKTVLVTGHTGFKGAWLTHWLAMLGARVVGFALPPETSPSLFELAKTASVCTHVEGDVRDLAALRAAFEAHQPEIVLHLAAQSLVRRGYREPVDTYATNVMGTVNLLEAARLSSSVRSVVVVTSDKCYENREQIWPYREVDAMGGHDPYSASKGAAELVTASYRSAFFRERGIGLASGRAGNVVGGGDWAEDRLIPDIVRGATRGETVLIRNPRSTRPWQHVLEPVGGYLLLAMRLHQDPARFAEGWNFGPNEGDDGVPVSVVAPRFVAALGRGELDIAKEPPPGAPHEAHLLRVDSTKARVELGFRPRLDLETTLAWTGAWYRNHLEQPGAERKLLEEQIAAYAALG